MALCRYLIVKPVTEGPNLCGPLSSTLTPATVKDANTAIKSCAGSSAAKPMGTYAKFTPNEQAAIAKYASLHGNKAVIRRFSKGLGKEIKDSSVSTWKKKYEDELKRALSASKSTEKRVVSVESLPVKKERKTSSAR